MKLISLMWVVFSVELLIVIVRVGRLIEEVRNAKSSIEESFRMTVQQIKDRLAQNRLDFQAVVTAETAEIVAAIGNQGGGATASQLDEIGQGIADNQAAAVAGVQSISDTLAGTPGPTPGPTPLP